MTRLRLWWLRQQYRLARWLQTHLPHQSEAAALHLLVVGLLTLTVFQTVLLVLLRPR
jgi:hypothetical protein